MALAILDGESTGIILVVDMMTLVVLPLSLTLMAGGLIILPIYLVRLMMELPHIIHCWGRISMPKEYPECYDTHIRSSNRHKFPECHPNCHLPYLANKNQNLAETVNQALPNIEPDDGLVDI